MSISTRVRAKTIVVDLALEGLEDPGLPTQEKEQVVRGMLVEAILVILATYNQVVETRVGRLLQLIL
jgi:hypothetical protein